MLVVVYGGHSGVIHYNCHIFHAECGGGLKKARAECGTVACFDDSTSSLSLS